MAVSRVLILAPAIIVADEPVSMLNASVRGEILNHHGPDGVRARPYAAS